jgi:hypothetical protein
MLFTKPPAQKGAVHKIARPEKKVAIFDPLKMDGRADGNQKKSLPSYEVTFSQLKIRSLVSSILHAIL